MKRNGTKKKFRGFSIMLTAVCLAGFIALAVYPGPAPAAEKTGMGCYKETAKTVTHGIAVGLGEVLKTIKGEKDRIELIRAFIDPIRFYSDQSGYFYVYNFTCVNIAHAMQKDLVGKNLTDYKDGRGKYVIRELSAAAKKGGGFVEYYWVKPGVKGEVRKLGYVEPIPGTDYFIGTGVYLP
jgi:signal transduction histidine kinase